LAGKFAEGGGMKLDQARIKRMLMSVRDNVLLNWRRYLPRVREVSTRLAKTSVQAFLACKKYAPNLRQLSGLVMIVNTFLPAIVVLTLGLMIWSTTRAIKHDACVTATYVTQAFGDDQVQKRYLAAPDEDVRERSLTAPELRVLDLLVAGESNDSIGRQLEMKGKTVEELLANIMKTMGARSRVELMKTAANKRRVLKAYVKQLKEGPPTDGGPCEAWKDVRASIKDIVVDKLYGKAVTEITKDIKAVGKDFDKMQTAVAKAVPSIGLIKYAGVPLVDQAIWAANQVVKVIRDALGVIGGGLKAVGSYLASPLATAQENVTREFQIVGYRQAAASLLFNSFFSDTTKLFKKFKWFFIILAIWFILSYVLWVYRRLSVGWALLCNRSQ
jgi:DNA-binding CsgD family transcriptional regulator